MADTNVARDITTEHIGAAHHPKRNLLLVAGLVIGGALIGVFYWQSAKSDSAAIDELQHFRAAMAAQCKQEQFARPAPKELNALYADSSRMQAVVHEQLGTLQRGQPNCDHIIKTIRSVDFPVE